MTRSAASAKAHRIAQSDRVRMIVVLEGVHRDEHEPEDSHGYCPEAAKEILYRYGTVVETVPVPVNPSKL